MTNQSTLIRVKLGVEMQAGIGYTRGVIIRAANSRTTSRFLLSKTIYTAIIQFAYLVTGTTPNGVVSLAALPNQMGFFIAPNAQKHPSQGGNPRVFLKGITL